VTTAKIIDDAVTKVKIADSNVTTAKILDANVTSAKLGPGTILQVIQAEKTNQQTASIASAAFATVTDLTATITPRATSSRIVVMYDLNINWSNGRGSVRLLRDSTAIGIGAADGNKSSVTGGHAAASGDTNLGKANGVVVDSPNTTSAISYTIEVQNNRSSNDNYFINRDVTSSNESRFPVGASRIVVMEVAG
jgi:hypothetical protein